MFQYSFVALIVTGSVRFVSLSKRIACFLVELCRVVETTKATFICGFVVSGQQSKLFQGHESTEKKMASLFINVLCLPFAFPRKVIRLSWFFVGYVSCTPAVLKGKVFSCWNNRTVNSTVFTSSRWKEGPDLYILSEEKKVNSCFQLWVFTAGDLLHLPGTKNECIFPSPILHFCWRQLCSQTIWNFLGCVSTYFRQKILKKRNGLLDFPCIESESRECDPFPNCGIDLFAFRKYLPIEN